MTRLNAIFTALFLMVSMFAYAQPEQGMPSEPGKCYAKCLIQDQYETVTEQVLVREAATKLKVVPGNTETLSEEVLVKEASNTLRAVPATFESVTE